MFYKINDLRKKNLKWMQSNQYKEKINIIKQVYFECFLACYLQTSQKWMQSTVYWKTKGH